MSLQTILVEAWTRRLVPSQWLKFTKTFLDQEVNNEPTDKTRDLCDLLIKSIRTSPNPSPILLEYLEEAIGSDSLIPEIVFLTVFSEEYSRSQYFEPAQLSALLPMIEAALTELNFRMFSLDVDSSVWKALATTSVMLCHIVQNVTNYTHSQLPDHKPEDDNIVVMDLDKPELDIDMPPLDVTSIEEGMDLELAYTSPVGPIVPEDEKASKDVNNTDDIGEPHWPLQVVVTEPPPTTAAESQTQKNAEKAASLLNIIFGNEKIRPALLKYVVKDSVMWDALHSAILETRMALGSLGDKITKSRPMMSLTSSIHLVLDDGGSKTNTAYIQYSNFRNESDGKCIPSSSLYFLVYHLMYRRPVLPDNLVLSRLQKLQRLMGDDQLFYLELWMVSLTGMAESCRNKAAVRLQLLWKSFILVKLPVLIAKLENLRADKSDTIDLQPAQSSALEHALRHISGMKGLLNCCRTSISEESNESEPPILGEIFKVCIERNLIGSDPIFGGVVGDQKLSNGLLSNESVEASTQAILNDPSNENIERLVLTTLAHFENQDVHIDVIKKLIVTWTENSELKPLGFLCQNLIENPQLLDTIVLMQHPKDILAGFEKFCNTWGSVPSEMQTSEDYESFGYAFILFVTIIERYKLQSELETIFQFPTEFSRSWFLKSSTSLFSNASSSENERIGEWIDALFVKKELTDEFIRRYSPQNILSLMPLIFEASLDACDGKVLDIDTLIKSFELLLQPAVSFSLIGVVLYLCEELTHSRQNPQLVPEVLKALLLNDKFPSHVLRAISERVTVAIGTSMEIEAQLWKVKEKIMLTVGDIAIAETLHNPGSTFKRFRQAFEAIVQTGRCKFVESSSWDLSKIHHLDIDLFRDALEFGGPRLFVRTIVQEMVRASNTKGALRSGKYPFSLAIFCILLLTSLYS
ncbi:hypothetical protein K7432_000886 [Basidiobolus ranarum]|uniref:Mediator of RNA polymerase II transcription subunit 5 n=1 Tax=Basidiobolus ranarum TaxID=34480 RepID=A0ABR2X4B4_9FUNG